MSDTGAPSLPNTTVISTVFKDRAVLRDTPRRHNIWAACELHPEPESAAQIDSCSRPCKTRSFRRFGRLLRSFGGYLGVTWRSKADGVSTALTVLTAFSSCDSDASDLQDHLLESHSWVGLLVKEPGPPRRHGTVLRWKEDHGCLLQRVLLATSDLCEVCCSCCQFCSYP